MLACVMCLSSCATQVDDLGQESAAIVNGVPDGNSHPMAGMLFVDDPFEGFIPLHSAFLVQARAGLAQDVVVTAAHAVRFAPPDAVMYVTFETEIFDFSTEPPTLVATDFIRADSFAFDPQCCGNWGIGVGDHDIAVVLLPQGSATSTIRPATLPRADFLGTLSNNTIFTLVGYGVDGPPTYEWNGLRNKTTAPHQSLNMSHLFTHSADESTGMGAICEGDSGGPVFVTGQERRAVAIETGGDHRCQGHSEHYRLDTPNARAFLAPYAALP